MAKQEMAHAENFDDENKNESEEQRLKESVEKIIARLEKEAEDRVGKRDTVEKRWLDDLSQYHGRYTDRLKKQLKEDRKSTLYINSTRPKTNAMSSRLSDMLFPTDDRNWGIKPTPVPELIVDAEIAARTAADAELAVLKDPDAPGLPEEAAKATAISTAIQATMEEARQRARSMETEIEDHLTHANYGSNARDIIEDACKIGTGILKGPIIGEKSRSKWSESPVINEHGEPVEGATIFTLDSVDDPRPVFTRVNPWNYFPDMDAATVEDSEGDYERHLMNKKNLKKLARQPGFDKDAIRRLLHADPRDSMPSYVADLRSITGTYHDSIADRYHVWEFHGQLSYEDMVNIASHMEGSGDEKMQEKASGIKEDIEEYEVDPLVEIEAVMWFCDGELLKFGLHHMDSGDPIYSIFNLEKDDSSVFGFGIPYIMRDPQKAMASAWRALMDNAGLASGPQIVVNQGVVEPHNGVWALEPRKIWLRKAGAVKGESPFEIVNIPSNIEDLSALIDLCKTNIDEETSMPIIAQGEQGANVTKTAHGMSLLMNSANVIFKRIVKNWDDDLTKPSIRRMYDFLMQFSKKDYIKGDYEVDARGTSVLLLREIQSANLLLFLTNFSGHPQLGRFLKDEGLGGLRRLAQTMMIPADELVKSDDEVAKDEAEALKQPPRPDPEMEKITADMNIKKLELDSRTELAYIERETALIRLASEQNMKLDELKAKIEDAREERRSKERIFAGEAAMTERQGKGGGGYL